MYTLTSPVRSRAITKSPSLLQPHVLYVKTLFCQAAALTRMFHLRHVRRLPLRSSPCTTASLGNSEFTDTHSPHTILLTIRTVRQKTQIDEVGIPMVLDPGAMYPGHQRPHGPHRPAAPTDLYSLLVSEHFRKDFLSFSRRQPARRDLEILEVRTASLRRKKLVDVRSTASIRPRCVVTPPGLVCSARDHPRIKDALVAVFLRACESNAAAVKHTTWAAVSQPSTRTATRSAMNFW